MAYEISTLLTLYLFMRFVTARRLGRAFSDRFTLDSLNTDCAAAPERSPLPATIFHIKR